MQASTREKRRDCAGFGGERARNIALGLEHNSDTEEIGMRVLVCGGRDFTDETAVVNALFRLEDVKGDFTEIIHGGARGADALAGEFARLRRAKEIVFRANWKRDGKAAGPLRNQRMLDQGRPDLVIAFPGGRGTADMTRRARAAGVEVIEVSPTPSRAGVAG